MKKFFSIPLLLLILGCYSPKAAQINKLPNPPAPLQLWDSYRVSGIDSIQNVYIIYAVNKTGQYKIVSLQDSSLNCTRLRVNDEIAFRLVSIVPNDTRTTPHVSGIMFHGVSIRLEERYQRNVFVATNITGLCKN